MIKLKEIGVSEKASLAYIMANIFSKGIYFITIPVFTRLLSTNDMGVFSTFTSWQTILYAIISLGFVSGSFNVAMVTFEGKRDRYMSVCLSASSLSAVVFLAVVFVFRDKWEMVTTLPYATLWIMVLYMFLQPAMDFWYARQRYDNKYKSVFWVSVLSTLLSSVASVFAVVIALRIDSIQNLGVVRIVSQYVILFLFAIVIYILIFVKGKTIYDRELLAFGLKLSLPLVVHTLAKNVLDISDRIMISNICGQSDAGIYGTIFTISLMALIVWNAINSALVPEMFESLKKSDFEKTEKKIYRLIILFGEISVVATLFSPEVIRFLTTSDYYEAIYLMPPLFASVFLSSIYNIYGNFLLYKKSSIQIMIATIVSAAFNVVTNYYFIQMFGYMAAAYTTLVSTLLLAVCQGIMQKIKYNKKVIDHKRIAIIGLIFTLGCLLSSIVFDYLILRFVLIAIVVIKACFDIKRILVVKSKNTD